MADFSKMTNKQKREYIWDYYKLPIIGGIILISIVVSVVNSMVNGEIYAFNLTVIGGYLDTEKNAEIGEDITKLLYQGDDRTLASVDYYSLMPDQNNVLQLDYNMAQKFTAKVAAKQIDVIILPEEMYNAYLQEGFFLDLKQVSGVNLLDSKLAQNEEGVFGVYLDSNDFYNIEEYESGKYILGIVSSTERVEEDVKVINSLLSK
ncbi:hypothetical protein [Clostridium grantii]|uniref:Uncharacterized protein n=1 Tax=Clostridium grantii DSM 8605 TaxID=1121316 RepID=A0A1M5VVV9_9CLOT|nr:hypothetical protein [Clostridium grantii]SHH79338.1 hypothetical protein SAMN02745207_02533 [Clostridium grantii DSM 8605]